MSRLSWFLPLAMSAAIAGSQDAPPRSNVLLVTIDALRADRVSEKLTPALTALAARGTRFERAYAHAPLTLPSHASILTGLIPPAHGVRNNGFRLDDTVVTLAEILAEAGYRTGAFVGASALDARFGLAQGFHQYDDHYDVPQGGSGSSAFRRGARPATAVLAAASAWIARERQPWFAWAHLRDPHAPYDLAAHRASAVSADAQTALPRRVAERPDSSEGGYDAGVASADAALGAFLSSPANKDLLSRTVIVVTADHGESLGDHGERTHGVFAYDSTLRVPLIVAGPGVPGGSVTTFPVSHVNVAPTVLDLVGVTPRAFDGSSVRRLMSGDRIDDAPIYFEALDAALMRGAAPLTGVVAGGWKYIDLPIPELYDLGADPGERNNLAASESGRVTALRDATVKARTQSPRADPAVSLAEPEARARLRSLGYVGSASWRLGASRVEDDPKKLLPLHLEYETAVSLAGPDPDSAIRRLHSIVAQRPDFAAALDAMGALLIGQGRAKEAVAILGNARAGGLRHRALVERLAAALLATKNPRGAVAVLQPVAEADDAGPDTRFLLARAFTAVGDVAEAVQQLKVALQLDPTFEAASDLLERLQKR